ncbi:hypothetical protein FXO38_13455 [Capsicum annuum]|nr:hypothetical protein FXO37_18753 [Capsicum annuum]KAF3658002.1 hypothetical protein FXO38_13455 [Capsicum annuum]
MTQEGRYLLKHQRFKPSCNSSKSTLETALISVLAFPSPTTKVFIKMERTIPDAPKIPMKAPNGSIAEENKKVLQFIEEVTTDVDEVQKRVLAEILSRNANVEYLQRHGLNGHTDRETFKKVIPVITYEDIQPDINCIAHGDKL